MASGEGSSGETSSLGIREIEISSPLGTTDEAQISARTNENDSDNDIEDLANLDDGRSGINQGSNVDDSVDEIITKRPTNDLTATGESRRSRQRSRRNSSGISLNRGTQNRSLHTKWLISQVSPVTLNAHNLPWRYDEQDDQYVWIEKDVTPDLLTQLFMHTREFWETTEDAVARGRRSRSPPPKPGGNTNPRPTWIKCKIKFLDPRTLDAYQLPWRYDPDDAEYVLITRYISNGLQNELFEHTRRLQQRAGRGSTRDSSRSPRPVYRRPSLSPSRSHSPLRSWSRSRSRSYSPRSPRIASSLTSDPTKIHLGPPRQRITRYSSHFFEPPTGDGGEALNVEVDFASANSFLKPVLSTKRTTDIIRDNFSLQSHLGLRSLLKASVMTARHTLDEEETFKIALEYADSPKYSPDAQFRWIHAQIPDFSLEQYKLFIASLPELEKEELTMTLALLNEVTETSNAGALPFFGVKRADAKGAPAEGEPAKWVIGISMSYLTETTSRSESHLNIPFTKFQHPLEPLESSNRRARIRSVRQTSPIHDISVVRLCAFVTFSGLLITLGPESFSDFRRAPLLITELSHVEVMSRSRKIRVYDPNGAAFHFPLKLCATYFALMRTIVTVCEDEFGSNVANYLIHDKDGKEVEAVAWQRYCKSSSGPFVDVWVRLLTTKPQTVIQRVRELGGKAKERSTLKSSKPSNAKPQIISTRITTIQNDSEETPDDERTTFAVRRRASGHLTSRTMEQDKKGTIQISLPKSHSEVKFDLKLPPNRVPRYLKEEGSKIVSNLVLDESESGFEPEDDDLVFRSRKSAEKEQGTNDEAQDTSQHQEESKFSGQSTTKQTPNTESTDFVPFLWWPTGDAQLEVGEESQCSDELDNVLLDVDTLLLKGYFDKEDSRSSQKHLASLYRASDVATDFANVNDEIEVNLEIHEAPGALEVTQSSSWQKLLLHTISEWDHILGSFCAPKYRHVVLGKFRHARAAFYKNVHSLCERYFQHAVSAARSQPPSSEATDTSFYILDCAQLIDDRRPPPLDPIHRFDNCRGCQYSKYRWPSFPSIQTAKAHLRDYHFEAIGTDEQLQSYIVPAQHLKAAVASSETRRLLLATFDHLRDARKLVDELREGVEGSTVTSTPYRLPRSLVKAFRQFIAEVLQAADMVVCAKSRLDKETSTADDMMRLFIDQVQRFVTVGYSLESTLFKAKSDIILQKHTGNYSMAVSYETVDSPYVLLNLLASLLLRTCDANDNNLAVKYVNLTDVLRQLVRRRPGKRLYNDMLQVKEEVDALQTLMQEQMEVMTNFSAVLAPTSFVVTTRRRHKQYEVEQELCDQMVSGLTFQHEILGTLMTYLDNLLDENVRSVAILQDDNGKAIMVFTVVTVIFLPLSFATSFLGMNTNDIRNMNNTQWLFWAIAMPLTFLTMLTVLVIGYLGDYVLEMIDDVFGRRFSPRTEESTTIITKAEHLFKPSSRATGQKNTTKSTEWQGVNTQSFKQQIARETLDARNTSTAADRGATNVNRARYKTDTTRYNRSTGLPRRTFRDGSVSSSDRYSIDIHRKKLSDGPLLVRKTKSGGPKSSVKWIYT